MNPMTPESGRLDGPEDDDLVLPLLAFVFVVSLVYALVHIILTPG